MNKFNESFETIEIRLPQGLLAILKNMAQINGKAINQTIVDLLEQAIFIEPEDLAMIKTSADRRAELTQTAEDEDIMVEQYKTIITKTKKAVSDLTKLKK